MPVHNTLSIEWTEATSADMDNISVYLLGENLDYAIVQEYVKRIFKAPEHLAIFPGAGKPGRMSGIREWRVKNTPYALVYRVLSDRIQILRIMHDSRLFSKWQPITHSGLERHGHDLPSIQFLEE